MFDIKSIEEAAYRTEPSSYAPCVERLSNETTVRLLHAAMGMVTEAGELMDMLKKHIIYGKPIDEVNAVEEIGDCTWYERIGAHAARSTFEQALEINVAKLRHRYPEKFTEINAIIRDLEGERQILETPIESHTCQLPLLEEPGAEFSCTCGRQWVAGRIKWREVK